MNGNWRKENINTQIATTHFKKGVNEHHKKNAT